MILILTIEKDHSTSNVIEWLLYYNKSFDRINYETILEPRINITKIKTEIQFTNEQFKKEFNLDDYSSYWYRRGNFSIYHNLINNFDKQEFVDILNTFFTEEVKAVQRFINEYLISNFKFINSFSDIYINKLFVLNKAKEIGLNIPETIITNKKTEIENFILGHKKIITKPIFNSLSFSIETTSFYFPTLLINQNDINDFPDIFPLAKFQSYINKSFELRVFYIKGRFYASAIFSQNDEQTKIDFRNYNEEKPNRVLPFNLPKNIKSKLNKLMSELKIDSGSFDLIVDTLGEYIFLEVNPIGQFTQVSLPCNYYLELEIAKTL